MGPPRQQGPVPGFVAVYCVNFVTIDWMFIKTLSRMHNRGPPRSKRPKRGPLLLSGGPVLGAPTVLRGVPHRVSELVGPP